MFNAKKIKKDFPIFASHPNLVYLDSSATSQTPQVVLDTMSEYYTKYRANTRRGQYTLGEQADEAYENARKVIADFIGAQPEEIIFTSGATGSMNMLIASLENSGYLKQGDEVVTTVMEHHSLLIPLQQLAKRKKLEMKYIGMTENFELDYIKAQELITDKTKIIACANVSNVTGTIHNPLPTSQSYLTVIDATQAVGHIPVDVKKLECDFLFFSGHKMCGPTGIGILYGKKELLEKLEPGFYGGGMVEDLPAVAPASPAGRLAKAGVGLDTVRWSSMPWKFEAGTPNIAGAIGLGAACKYLKKIGVKNIEAHIRELTGYALGKLAAIPGVKLYCEKGANKNAGVISFALEGAHPHDVAEILSRDNIAIRAGHHCALPLIKIMKVPALTRASIYLYNTKVDIGALVLGVEKARKTLTSTP